MNVKRAFPVLALLALSACAQNPPSGTGDTYRNEALDLSVEKPEGWIFKTAEESERNAQAEDDQAGPGAQEPTDVPTVAIMKYRPPHPTINPTFQINHVEKPAPEVTPEQLLEAATMQLQLSVADFELTEPPQQATLSGHPGARLTAEYMVQSVETGEVFTVRTRMWVIERDNDLFIIGMSAPAQGEDQATEQFSEILSSVSIGG